MKKIIQQSGLPKYLHLWQSTMNWQPDEGHILEFQSFYDFILEANQQMNLTRIVEPKEFWEKHLWDSLRGISPFLQGDSIATENEMPVQLIDIGTGAGFPGLPIAIARPDWQVTLFDSTNKKIIFINSVIHRLGMENAQAITARAEELGREPEHRSQYHVAVSRAVAEASVCAEYALPLLKIGGLGILYRGNWTDEETYRLENTVKKLGGAIDFIEKFETPFSKAMRHCIYLRKIAPTPEEYPRTVGLPSHKPL